MSGSRPLRIASEQRWTLQRFWFGLSQFCSRLAAIVFFDVRLIFRGRLPRRGRVVMAPNHQSFLDPWLAGMWSERQVCFLARDTLFAVPLLGPLISSLNSVPVVRGSQSARRGMEAAISVLNADRGIVLFPEGTRSPDGRMGPLKRGIALVLRQTGAPVLPLYITGSFDAWPRQRRVPRFGAVRIVVGEPIGAPSAGGPGERAAAAQASDVEKNAGESAAAVDDGRFLASAAGAAEPPPDAALAPSRGGVPLDDAFGPDCSPDRPPSAPCSDSAPVSRKQSAAVLLEALGEAYRVLEVEAQRVRRSTRPCLTVERLLERD